ncbi:MAG: hypothetical protein GX234_10085 [Clostridiales bacterium]|nr:hypothetical protein [Clostridiales bacterium]
MNRVTRRENKREQKILKALSKGERGFARILKWLFYLLEVFCFMRMVYYGRFEMRGISTEGRFQNELIAFLIVAGCIAFLMLFDWGMKKSWEKEADFDPQQMKLPEAGSVDLEKALHYMSMCQGVIAWDTCWGTFALFSRLHFLFREPIFRLCSYSYRFRR